jgi:hypothetical protein
MLSLTASKPRFAKPAYMPATQMWILRMIITIIARVLHVVMLDHIKALCGACLHPKRIDTRQQKKQTR